jgi:PsbP
MRLVPKVAIGALVFACLALAACGGGDSGNGDGGSETDGGVATGGGEKTFEGDGYSFSYPAEWAGSEPMSVGGGAFTVAIIPVREGTDGVYVTVSPGTRSVTADNFDRLRDDIIGFVEATIAQDQGQLTSEPTRATLDGLPALRFEGTVVTVHGDTARFRATTAFDGPTVYHINCQAVPAGADEVNQGCDQVLESFQVE